MQSDQSYVSVSNDAAVLGKYVERSVIRLRARAARETQPGGCFQTLVPIKLANYSKVTPSSSMRAARLDFAPSLTSSRVLSTPESMLLDRWLYLAGSKGPDKAAMYSIGEWITITPHRIRDSLAVRWAATCLLDSTLTFTNKTDRNLSAVRDSNSKALRCIRKDLEASGVGLGKSDVMLAIKLLFMAEVGTHQIRSSFSRNSSSAHFHFPAIHRSRLDELSPPHNWPRQRSL
jgi:hypothetical protein